MTKKSDLGPSSLPSILTSWTSLMHRRPSKCRKLPPDLTSRTTHGIQRPNRISQIPLAVNSSNTRILPIIRKQPRKESLRSIMIYTLSILDHRNGSAANIRIRVAFSPIPYTNILGPEAGCETAGVTHAFVAGGTEHVQWRLRRSQRW